MSTKNYRLILIIGGVALLLLVPLVAMQFSDDVSWSVNDFIIAGVLLSGTGLLIELILRNVKLKQNRLILSAIVLVLLILIWIELAVGLFGSPLAGS